MDDRLDATWKKLREEIQRREAELKALKEKFELLDQARALVLAETSPGEAALMRLREGGAENAPATLQDAVLQFVRHSKTESPLSPAEVVAGLRRLGYESGDSTTFYSAVYVALRRLTRRGEISAATGPRGMLFMPNDATRSLFANASQSSGGLQ